MSERVPVPAGYREWPLARTWDEAWWAAWLRGKGWADAEIVRYLNERRALTFSVTRGAETTVLYAPTPRGVQLHLSTAPSLLYGGAAGGSKSHTARWDAFLRLFAVPGTQTLMLRRRYTELMDNHINDTLRESAQMKGLGLAVQYLKDERRMVVTHPDGQTSWLRFGHCENEGDEENYLSSPYDVVYVDEAATFTKKQVMGINSRLRSATGLAPRLVCTSNPGGSHTLWLKQWFIDKTVGPEEDAKYDPADWAFIPSKLYDNPYYMDPDGTWTTYEKRLTPLGPERARQMLEGDWDVIAGQYFPEFSRNRHVEMTTIAPEVQWFRCLDWGYNNPGVCLWIACLPDGHLHVRHEYVFRQTIAHEVAKQIRQQTRDLAPDLDRGITIRYTVADPSMWNKSGQSGESIAETVARAGVPMIKGSNERVIGWQRMRHWFQTAPDGRPWLTVDPSCAYLLRTIPSLVSDDTIPEDVDTAGEDHAADALRYGLMSRPTPSTTPSIPPERSPFSVGAMLAGIRRDAMRRPRLGQDAVRR